jgi:hypothetical protein
VWNEDWPHEPLSTPGEKVPFCVIRKLIHDFHVCKNKKTKIQILSQPYPVIKTTVWFPCITNLLVDLHGGWEKCQCEGNVLTEGCDTVWIVQQILGESKKFCQAGHEIMLIYES